MRHQNSPRRFLFCQMTSINKTKGKNKKEKILPDTAEHVPYTQLCAGSPKQTFTNKYVGEANKQIAIERRVLFPSIFHFLFFQIQYWLAPFFYFEKKKICRFYRRRSIMTRVAFENAKYALNRERIDTLLQSQEMAEFVCARRQG